MKRRSFLRHMTHAVAVPGVLGTMGFKMPGANSLTSLLRNVSADGRVLVMIYLEGGNDGLNTVIPLDQLSALNKVRPDVILPDNSLIDLKQSEVALHPSLSGLASLYDESRLQIIQNVGYPEQNYSHFRSTDIWMSGSDAHELVSSGWGGRFLDEIYDGYPEDFPNDDMTDPLAVEMGFGSSLLFQGPTSTMSMVINDPNDFYRLLDNEVEEAPNTLAGEKLKFVRLIERQSQQYGELVRDTAKKIKRQATYPDSSLGEQLKIVSRLIAGGMKTPLYMVRLGGFDTHDAQVEASDHTKGEHNDLLTDLNDSIMAFMEDLEMQGTDDRVLGMTFSEFGRRIVSNASLGTDHGAAAPLFVFGNAVQGGVTGNNPIISPNATYEDNLPWEHDFRQIYTSVLDQWLGAGENTIDTSVLGSFNQVPIIGESVLEEESPVLGIRDESKDFLVYPNPLNGKATISTGNISEPVSIELVDLNGRVMEKIFYGNPKLANAQIPWNTADLPIGRYYVVMRSNKVKRSFPVLKAN